MSQLDYGNISSRIDRLPATFTIWKYIVLLGLGFFFELYDILYAGYIASALKTSGLLTSTDHLFVIHAGIASFIAALFAGLLVGTLLCSSLADRYGRRAIFTYALLWYAIANAILAFQNTTAGLYFWRFLAGIGLGVEIVTIGAYLAELSPQSIRGRAFACLQAIGFIAVPLVAILSYFFVPLAPLGLAGWRWVILFGSLGALFAWWFRRQLPESPRWLAQQGRLVEADQVLSVIEEKVGREYGQRLPEPVYVQETIEKGELNELLRPPYRKRVLMLMVFNIFQTIGYYGFAHWVPTLLQSQGITTTSSLLYSSMIAIVAPLGPIIGLIIADRFERKYVIVLASLAIILFGMAFTAERDPVWLIVIGIGLTVASNMMGYSFHLYQAELFPTRIRAMAIGFVYSWSRLSAIFSSFLIALALSGFGTKGAFTLIAMSMFIVMLVVGLMGPKTKGKSLEAISP